MSTQYLLSNPKVIGWQKLMQIKSTIALLWFPLLIVLQALSQSSEVDYEGRNGLRDFKRNNLSFKNT
ncbi:hypothetical protein RIR_jg11086.t1 [Rhizophagus irregularis DAOM 181602=DAOM 197198]|nr:hypothetical protein RIR_jg11086.t1 [Rhizophagus irregularis DAOM 181602=DAOM 197198]